MIAGIGRQLQCVCHVMFATYAHSIIHFVYHHIRLRLSISRSLMQ